MRRSRSGRRQGRRISGLAVLVCVGVVALGGSVLSEGLARLRPRDRPALTADQSPPVWDAAAAEARRTLRTEPLSARAFSRLGQVAALKGDEAGADLMMAAAARRSLRDAPSQSWILARAFERGDDRAAFAAFDVLMRRRSDLFAAFAPAVFGELERRPQAVPALASRLALSPAWRPQFVTTYSRNAENPQNAYALLQALRAAEAPPTDAELQVYIDRLVKARSYVAAYVAWVQHQAAGDEATRSADGGVHDGGFEGPPAVAPFGWTLRSGDGAAARRGLAADGSGGVLQASAVGGLSRRVVAEQMLVLAPGAYALTGRVWVRSGEPEGRFIWTVRCAGGAELASRPEADAGRERWTPFAVALEIPSDCPAQVLSLEARPGASLAQAEVDYDQLAVARKAGR